MAGLGFADSLILVVLDSPAPYLGGGAESPSLLSLPVGDVSLLEHLARELLSDGQRPREILVAPTFSPGADYGRSLGCGADHRLRVASMDDVAVVLRDHEASDDVLLVDPRFWPVGGYPLAELLPQLDGYRGVTHIVALGTDHEAIHEWVQHESDGRVKGVHRYYDSVTWPQAATRRLCLSLVSSRVIGRPISFSSLSELRSELAVRGVFSQDTALRRDVHDLHQASGLLALSEELLTTRMPFSSASRDPVTSRPGLHVGRNSRIHPHAKVVPPVVVQDQAVIESGAVIIGPSVIGARSRVGSGAVVAHSVVACESVVPAGMVLREQVTWVQMTEETVPPPGSDSNGRSVVQSSPADGLVSTMRLVSEGTATTRDPAERCWYEWATRSLNVLLSGLGIVLLGPLGLMIALIIKLDSAGPVLFGHIREGRRGRSFRCLKFRTMVAGAHSRQRELYEKNELDGPQFKLRHDPRVTRVGRWMRSTNLDELPQLINVFIGDMNLVGPRPSPFRENQICVPWRRARLSVRPGITGLWQLCRDNRSGGDFHQWIYFDLAYVRHLSFWLDLKILLATLLTLGGRWSISMHRLVRCDEVSPRLEHGRYATANAIAWLALAIGTATLAAGGCYDPRISLEEFLTTQQPEAQATSAPAETPPVAAPLVERVLAPYRVGPSDVLTVSLTGTDLAAAAPIMQVRVDREGTIQLPLVGAVKVADMEEEDVEEAIHRAYVPSVLKDVAVHVEVATTDVTQVLVVGAVTTPGLVRLRRTERNLLFALVAAGGVTADSSGKARLQRIRRPGEEVTLNLTEPKQLEAALALHPLEDGDIVTVIPAHPNTVFVGGLVNLPRPQPYPAGVEITVLQAIAAAGGLRTDVTPREATLIRRQPDGQDVHVKIDLDRVTTARDPNITLAAGDILWVPDTVETRVQDWINRNVYLRAGASVHYDVSGVEYLNRASQQSGGGQGGDLQDSFDPFGFLNRNAALQNLTSRPPTTP